MFLSRLHILAMIDYDEVDVWVYKLQFYIWTRFVWILIFC